MEAAIVKDIVENDVHLMKLKAVLSSY